MAKANLTPERLRELLDYDADTGVFTWRRNMQGGAKAGDVAGTLGNHGYLVVRLDRVLYLAQRLAWLYVHGGWPANKADHRNRLRTDNRINNLRDASDVLNSHNSTPRSNYPGVSRIGAGRRMGLQKQWMAQIMSHGKRYYLGYYTTPEEAHAVYLAAKRRLHEGCTI